MEPTRFMTIANEYKQKYENALIEIGKLEQEIQAAREEATEWRRRYLAAQPDAG